MRRIHLIIVLFFITVIVKANIIPEHYIHIGGLEFNDGNWKLTIATFQYNPEEWPIDSIMISSLTDSIMLTNLSLGSDYDNLIIYQDSIDEHFAINQNGDIIKAIGYSQGEEIMNWYFNLSELRFGDVVNSIVRKPNNDESIVGIFFGPVKDLITGKFIICKKNNSSDSTNSVCIGMLKGQIYDFKGNLKTDANFWIDEWFSPDDSGNFEVPVYSYFHKLDKIFYWGSTYDPEFGVQGEERYVSIKEVSFNMSPDSTVLMDIYLAEEVMDIKIGSTQEKNYSVFPNPIDDRIYIKSTELNKQQVVQIQLLNIKGQEVANYSKKAEEIVSIELNAGIHAGIYVINILENNRIVYSEKIIVNPF